MTIQTSWDLGVFYSSTSDPQIQADLDQVDLLKSKFIENYKTKLDSLEPNQIKQLLLDEAEMSRLITKVYRYYSFSGSLDTQNQSVLKAERELMQYLTTLSNDLLFVSEEFRQMGEAKVLELRDNEELSEYKNYFNNIAENIKHQLDERTENALNLKSTSGASAWKSLYEEYTGDLSYEVEVDCETKTLNDSELRALLKKENRQNRENAHKAATAKFSDAKMQTILSSAYMSIVNSWGADVKMRGYDTPISIRNSGEEVEDKTIQTLLETVREYYHVYHEFLAKKQSELKLNELQYWDLYAPVGTVDRKFDIDSSVIIYKELMKDFDTDFHDYTDDIFSGRVDVLPGATKRGGAYASYDKDAASYVMLNHTDDIDSVFTLAHELGHATHGQLSQPLPEQVFGSPLVLAETASIFNELLLHEHFRNELSEKELRTLKFNQLDDMFATIFRQVMYVSFEEEVHNRVAGGEQFTASELNDIWKKHIETLVGPELVQHERYAAGWSMIPHIFFTPFYCYSYAFGNLLSISLFADYQNNKTEFIPKYKSILAAGGSVRPAELLAEHGYDINSKEFYTMGLDLIKQMVNEL